MLGRTDGFDSDGFLTALAEALVLSGLAMAVGRVEPPVQRSLPRDLARDRRALPRTAPRHGEQVAVGALFASFLREDGVVDELDAAYGRLGVARVPGRPRPHRRRVRSRRRRAPSTRPDRYTILEHLDLDEDEIRERGGALSMPSIAELRAVAQPESLLARRGDEHWAGRLYMRRLSIRPDAARLGRRSRRTP